MRASRDELPILFGDEQAGIRGADWGDLRAMIVSLPAGTSLQVATATPDPNHSPAGPLWLPLQASGPRSRLIDLAQAW